jgi:outer membrane receptor protein involved in Fe transport
MLRANRLGAWGTPLAGLPWSIATALALEVGSESTVLEEIVVTATRRPIPSQDAPVSVFALSERRLHAIDARDLIDYFAHVPGLSYSDDGWSTRLAIRGIASGTFVEPRPLSALYLDDTPMMTVSGPPALGQMGGPHPEVFDLNRIEVLRGPQGALFGTSALGGAIRMITNRPDPGAWHASFEAGISGTQHGGDNQVVSGVLNVPFGAGAAALRAGGYYRDEAGFLDDTQRSIEDVNSAETGGGRLALLWSPATDLTMTLSAHHQERRTGGIGFADRSAGDYAQRRYVPERNDERWSLFNLAVSYQLPWAEFTSLSSYIDRRPANTYDDTLFIQSFFDVLLPTSNEYTESLRDVVQELRLTSSTRGRFSWLTGLYYQDQDRANTQDVFTPGFDALTGGLAASYGYPDQLVHTVGDAAQQQRALYGELTYNLTPLWQASVGGRRFEFRERERTLFDGVFFGGPVPTGQSLDQDGTTMKGGIVYRPNENMLLFANAAEGFRPGGTNSIFTEAIIEQCQSDLDALGLSAPPVVFGSDSLWSYELGAKANWLDRRLTTNITAYHIDWSDMQTAKGLGCGITFIENSGRAENRGAELEAAWQPAEWMELYTSAAYIDAKLAKDVSNVSGEEGESIPTVPRWTLSAGADAEFPLTARAQGFARLDYQYIDSSWNDFDQDIRQRLPARQMLAVRAGARVDAWEIELFVENALDERGVLFQTLYFGDARAMLIQPRTIGLRARYSLVQVRR